MSEADIPKEVIDFVFQYIDSAEQLEVLLLLSTDPEKIWSCEELSQTLRSSRNSVERRLRILLSQGLIKDVLDQGNKYKFDSQQEILDSTVKALANAYRSHRHRILEMIFSPLKKGRDFADAFKLSSSKDAKGGRNG